MAKCPVCRGKGYRLRIDDMRFAMAEIVKCESCDGKGVVEPLTEQEYIQTCTTEQLADVLMKIFVTRTFCHLCPEGDVCDIGYKCKYHGGTTKDFVEWLKQPHTTGGTK